MVADLRDRIQVGFVRLEIGAHGARPLDEDGDGSVTRERRERELLLPLDSQPGPARDGDLQAGARGDDRRERGGRLDDLLEVVDDEQQPAAFEMSDEALLEIALAVEEPERPCDRADRRGRDP